MSNEYKKLYRSEDDRMIAGVAAGLGNFLGIDPTIIRLLFVFSMFLGGTGALAYVVFWMVVPEADQATETVVEVEPKPVKKAAPKRTSKAKAAKAA